MLEEAAMTTTQQDQAARPSHPFPAAIATRDHAALVDTLASDVVLHAAVTAAPFEGRETVADVYASVIDSFEEVEVVDEFASGDTHAFFWRGRIEGRFVEGADRLRLDSEGRVREITVVGRPLSGLATFLTGIGSRFARRRRGEFVATILRVTALPLGPLFSLLDPLTRWLARPTTPSRG
jgi:ketosteroid isomerase-like protein